MQQQLQQQKWIYLEMFLQERKEKEKKKKIQQYKGTKKVRRWVNEKEIVKGKVKEWE